VGQDSVVGMTCYGLDGPGNESQRRQDFSHLSRLALGLTQLPVQVSFPEVNQLRHGVDHLPLLVPKLKKEYSYTSAPPSGPTWVEFTFTFFYLYYTVY